MYRTANYGPRCSKRCWDANVEPELVPRGGAKRLLWWLTLVVVAASLFALVFFSAAPGPPLACEDHPPRDVAQPAWVDSVVDTPAYALDALPHSHVPLRRRGLGYGGSTHAARWRIWGCHAGELPGENAQLIRTRLYFDTVVVQKRRGGDGGSWVGGSGGMEKGGGERGVLVDGVVVEGKRRVGDAAAIAIETAAAVETTTSRALGTAETVAEESAEHQSHASHPPQPLNPPTQPQPASQTQDGTDGTGGVDIFFQGEFGYELIAVLPFAYWHHLRGSLRYTTSCGRHSLASLYYFSPNHTDDATCRRSAMKNNVAAYGFSQGIHYSRIPPAWQPPPLAHHFRKFPPVWPEIPKGSRLVVIGNKYEREWGRSPVNFIDLPTLMGIVTAYLDAGFYVVYNNPGMSLQPPRQASRDGKDLGDYEALQERVGNNPRLQIMQDLQKRWPELSFNEVQFRLLARSACFVSVRGEGSIVESYFGGQNIIYFREGQEVKGKAYERIYPQLAGAMVTVVTSYMGLEREVDGMIQKNNCYAKLDNGL